MILVTGATGKIGTALVAQLQAQHIPFRALAHTAASHKLLTDQHVESVLVPDQQGATLLAAFERIDRLFLLTPSSSDQLLVERRLVDAAQEAGIKQIVKLSVFGVEDQSVSIFHSHRESEHYIRQSGVSYTFLRPNLFMQNLGTTDAALIKQQNAIFNSAGSGVVSFIDTRDIAAVALAVLQDERHRNQTYDLTGQEAISYGDVARKLTNLLDRSIGYIALDDDAYHAALVSAGLPDWYADGLTELYAFYRAGKGAAVTDLVERITGTPARTIDTYLADYRTVFA